MLKSKKKVYVNKTTIVQLMEERGVRSIKMKDGESVDIKPFILEP